MHKIDFSNFDDMKLPPLENSEKLTWINYWPEEVLALKREKFVKLPLTPRVCEAIIERAYKGTYSQALENLRNEVAVHLNGRPVFVRTNKRSPKDATDDLPLYGEEKIVDALCSSMRVTDDLSFLGLHKEPAYLYIFPFNHAIQEREVRCFVKNHKLIAMTQYKPGVFSDDDVLTAEDACRELFEKLDPRMHLDSYVFDAWMSGCYANFLEINPYGKSAPCFFKSYEAVEKGGFAYQKTVITNLKE